MKQNECYRILPKIDRLLAGSQGKELVNQYGREAVVVQLQEAVAALRKLIQETAQKAAGEMELETAQQAEIFVLTHAQKQLAERFALSLKRVINATGIVLHTNLGRAVLPEAFGGPLSKLLCGYSNLEFSLETGQRGERYAQLESLLCELTGAEAALAVNNNAAAVLLLLNTLARGKETIISRGELVEIGGGFRIPEVMEQSGSVLVETGTTNKTRIADYEAGITENTALLLKVHTSNYRIVGFTESAGRREICELAHQKGIWAAEDLGSGAMVDLQPYGLHPEPTVREVLLAGMDLVCFSGDKLFGGPQAGIVVGKKAAIAAMKKNPLLRALRIDKFTATALILTLLEYQKGRETDLPVYQMLGLTREELQVRAQGIVEQLPQEMRCRSGLSIEIQPCVSYVGGGACPAETLDSWAIAIHSNVLSAEEGKQRLRNLQQPIIARLADQQLLLDVRTIQEPELAQVAAAIQEIWGTSL